MRVYEFGGRSDRLKSSGFVVVRQSPAHLSPFAYGRPSPHISWELPHAPSSSTVTAMPSPHAPSSSEPNNAPSGKAEPLDLVAISKATGVSVDVLQTFSKISDPSNKHVFTAEAAQKAFSGVKV